LIIDKKRRDKMKDKVCRCKEEGCCSYAGNKTTHQKVLQYMKIIYIEKDNRMKKMMKTILD